MNVHKVKAARNGSPLVAMIFSSGVVAALLLSQSSLCSAEPSQAINTEMAPLPGPRLGSSLFSSEPQVRGNRVVRSIQSNGIVAFGDQVDAGAKEVKTITVQTNFGLVAQVHSLYLEYFHTILTSTTTR